MQRFRDWSRRIRTASTTAAVLEVIGNFLGSIPPTELEQLSRELRVEITRAPQDIQAVALDVLRDDLRFSGEANAAQVLHEVALTFAEASGRVAEIEGEKA